jgi:hypothetical protein
MRFLNTTTLRFEEVADSELDQAENQYAILSHRWYADADEVTYSDMMTEVDHTRKAGWAKIRGFCRFARQIGCRYGWVDTCCINKSNSSELAEAINSMFMWYRESKECVVYLQDVPTLKFEDSEWLDRGWTLQELIAPNSITFFDQNWRRIGTKRSLLSQIRQKTGIPKSVVDNTQRPSTCSVAQRMSWAAARTTKRIEDRAYSLLGLFEVHMPMIYGEREQAFVRLQQQIAMRTKDESLFAWSMGPPNVDSRSYTGIYALSPAAFAVAGNIVPLPSSPGFAGRNGEMSLSWTLEPHNPGNYRASLHCAKKSRPDQNCYIIISKSSNAGGGTFLRVRDVQGVSIGISDFKVLVDPPKAVSPQEVQIPVTPTVPPITIVFGFWLRSLRPPGSSRGSTHILSSAPAPQRDHLAHPKSRLEVSGLVYFGRANNISITDPLEIRWLQFGSTSTRIL